MVDDVGVHSHDRGLLQLSNEAIYFQPHPNFSSEPVKQVPGEAKCVG